MISGGSSAQEVGQSRFLGLRLFRRDSYGAVPPSQPTSDLSTVPRHPAPTSVAQRALRMVHQGQATNNFQRERERAPHTPGTRRDPLTIGSASRHDFAEGPAVLAARNVTGSHSDESSGGLPRSPSFSVSANTGSPASWHSARLLTKAGTDSEDHRQGEIKRRLASQRRRSQVMHSKIVPKERPHPSLASAPPPIQLQPDSAQVHAEISLLWIAEPTFAIPTRSSYGQLWHSAPFPFANSDFQLRPPISTMQPAPHVSHAPPHPLELVVSSPPRKSPPPRQLTVVPPLPPFSSIRQTSGHTDHDYLCSLSRPAPNPDPSCALGSRATSVHGHERASRLSVTPLIRDIRPPAAWNLPHGPPVSARKTGEAQS